MKVKFTIILFFNLWAFGIVYGQVVLSPQRLEKTGDSLYYAKNYSEASTYYLNSAAIAEFKVKKVTLFYNASCCLSLDNKIEEAIIELKKAISLGYDDKNNLLNDKDLLNLHNHQQWQNIVKSIKKEILNTDPSKAKFITEDVHRFWKAYDKANADTSNFKAIFKKEYFEKASKGMDDYMSAKVSSINYFVEHIKSAPNFYKSIRKSTLNIDDQKKDFTTSFKKFKDLYPNAKFPNVYFIIGAFTSGGTATNAGLLIGLNQASQTEETPIDELDFKDQSRMSKIKYVSNTIAHELIHFQQGGMKNDTTTLSYAIREGMADFIGELISGSTSNEKLMVWAKGKEKKIWENFKKDIYYDRYSNWIANGDQSTPNSLPDQGYWVGYQICKSYYENGNDKKKTIKEMLNIQDYKKFLANSKWEEKLSKMK
ncbi:tetratricopeptide (TPR) repeat protein [Pedobacter sp. CG_S7]|uniref:gliding motility protein GldB-related protein n=1 Tax=Pedobacter sp. CG_S7 TaxID=3143930 RepID=UPI00339AFD03